MGLRPYRGQRISHLNVVHVLLKGLLGNGGSSNLRVDQIGKAVGEYIRAKHIQVPKQLLEP